MKFQILALAVVGFVAGAASAQTPALADGGKVVVRYADLDLTREQGASVLARRINQAAHVICGPEPRPVSLDEYFRYRTCVNDSAEAAVHEVGSPLVAAAYERNLRPMMLAKR